MAKTQATRTPAAKTVTAAPTSAMAQMAATVQATPEPAKTAPKTIALRGGQAVSQVALTGAPYRTGAPHNAQWWDTLCKSLKEGPQPVTTLLLSQAQPQGVPAHFIGYALRRGYLKSVA